MADNHSNYFNGDIKLRPQFELSEWEQWLGVIYVFSALCFTVSIFNFRKPSTSQIGNVFGIIGMLTAVCGTLASGFVNSWGYAVFAPIFLVVGALGVYAALKVQMTSMPMFVGLLNAMGGLAAALESLALYVSKPDAIMQDYEWSMYWGFGGKRLQIYNTIFYLLGMIIGIITFTGSVIACLKLKGKFSFSTPSGKKTYRKMLKMRTPITLFLFLIIFALGITAGAIGLTTEAKGLVCFVISMVFAGIYGIFFVLCIGGADMPVVIALLNSLSGWSTVFAGLAFTNDLMIIAGCFVGASGLILSVLMCNAMNRSMKNVMMGGFGGDSEVAADAAHIDAFISDSASIAKVIFNSKLVYIVPGYGMAVSQAQQQVAELIETINNSGREARCAVHPVAGRLPGHMNVLLAEANVPYNYVDDITANDNLPNADCVIIVGANDIYNPAAKFDKSSNIYGMEVLEVWHAKRTVVVKRSMRTGYAGIDNALFYYPHNSMLLGDAKEAISSLTAAFKEELASGTEDSVDAWISGDDQRIAVRVEEEKRLKAMSTQTKGDVEEEELVKVADSAAPVSVGVLREPTELGDNRIPIHPKDIEALLTGKWQKWNVERVLVEKVDDEYIDAPYENAGAITCERGAVLKHSDICVSISIPSEEDLIAMTRRTMNGSEYLNEMPLECKVNINGETVQKKFSSVNTKPILISLFGNPSNTAEKQAICQELGITLVSMDIMPRVTTAQCMDVLSSSAKVAGFRSVIEACNQYGRLVGAEITAAGSYKPAKCLVVGVGVAGLAAIGDMHRLGAEVRAFDVRKECADQVKSMGGKFLIMDFGDEDGAGEGGYANIMSQQFIDKEMALFHEQAKEVNLFILTAAIPGRPAPKLIMKDHVAAMQRGSVIVDLAAPTGGNCEITRPGENYVTQNGVKIIGKVDFQRTVGRHLL